MKNLARVFTTVVFALVSSLALAAEQPAHKAEDLDRWLEEYMKVFSSPAGIDEQKAFYTEAAAKGNIFVSLSLERIAQIRKDEAEARKWAQASEANNVMGVLNELAVSDARAQYLVGFAFSRGLAQTPTNEAAAFDWFRKAAEQGSVEGQVKLGDMYDQGQGVNKDEAQAVAWYRKAAEQGHFDAQFILGGMIMNGQGVNKDEAQAAAWVRKAAEQGYDQAQYVLGLLYLHGQGVNKDKAQAAAWWRKAAEQGHAEARKELDGLQ